jgi:hypothetical protein
MKTKLLLAAGLAAVTFGALAHSQGNALLARAATLKRLF